MSVSPYFTTVQFQRDEHPNNSVRMGSEVYGRNDFYDVVYAAWNFRVRRKTPSVLYQTGQVAFAMPHEITVETDPEPPLRTSAITLGRNYGVYDAAPYSFSHDDLTAVAVLQAYDNFFMDRKGWKQKTTDHFDHLLKQMGMRRTIEECQ